MQQCCFNVASIIFKIVHFTFSAFYRHSCAVVDGLVAALFTRMWVTRVHCGQVCGGHRSGVHRSATTRPSSNQRVRSVYLPHICVCVCVSCGDCLRWVWACKTTRSWTWNWGMASPVDVYFMSIIFGRIAFYVHRQALNEAHYTFDYTFVCVCLRFRRRLYLNNHHLALVYNCSCFVRSECRASVQ